MDYSKRAADVERTTHYSPRDRLAATRISLFLILVDCRDTINCSTNSPCCGASSQRPGSILNCISCVSIGFGPTIEVHGVRSHKASSSTPGLWFEPYFAGCY